VTDLETLIREAVERDGLEELVLRVTAFKEDGRTPEKWQSLAKLRATAKKPWGVSITASPVSAVRNAIAHAKRIAGVSEITTDNGGLFD
jgi:hypothetical protein